ncbi:hypothetical protein Tco_0649491 [Tanacetum coccineum]
MFKNAFNSEFKARMQKYTRFDAQSLYDAMIFHMDSIGKYMLKITLHQQRTPQLLKQKKLMQTQEDHSNPIPALNVDSLKVDLVVIQNTCFEKEDSNSKTASSKSVKERSLDYATKDVHAIKYKMSKAKERCITMLLNVDQLQKQLDKDEFQEDGSLAAFWVINKQFQQFIDSKFTLDYDSQMTDKYFFKYTGIEVKHFRDTLLQHMGNVKKSVAERTRHQRQYDRRVNKRQMQTQESKIDTGKAVDAALVVTKSSGTESEVQDDSSKSGNDTDADDADIRSIYDEEPMVEIKKEIDVLETMNIELEHSVAKLRKENETLKKHYKDLYDSIKITRSKTIEQTTSLLANNVDLKAQIQEKVFAIAALKNDLRKLKGNSVDTKFAKTSVLGKLVLQSLRNQSVVRQPNAFKSERPQMSTPRFASQVDVSNNLSRRVTQHYLPKRRKPVFAKPDHMIASSESRNSSKNMPRFSSNDMIVTRHRFSPNKTFVVDEKTSPRSDLRWKPTGRIFKSVGLRWIPIGKLFDSCTGKDDSEPTHGSNVDIPNIHECK